MTTTDGYAGVAELVEDGHELLDVAALVAAGGGAVQLGPDVSHHQGAVPWGTVAGMGCPFAVAKVWESVEDDRFAGNWRGMASAGIPHRGAYTFGLVADAGNGAIQAGAGLAAVDRAGGYTADDLAPVFDVEWGPPGHPNNRATKSSTVGAIRGWARQVKAAGMPASIYGRRMLLDLGIVRDDVPEVDALWAPRYNSVLGAPAVTGWPDDLVVAWQYTNGVDNFTSWPKAVPGWRSCDFSVALDLGAWTIGGTMADGFTDADREELHGIRQWQGGYTRGLLTPAADEPTDPDALAGFRAGRAIRNGLAAIPGGGGGTGALVVELHGTAKHAGGGS